VPAVGARASVGRSHRWLLAGTLLLLGAVLSPAPAAAQSVTGRLVDGASGGAIDAGMITLVDSAGREVDRTLTDAVGRYLLDAPAPGTYELRIDRLGYASAHAGPFRLAAGDTLVHRIEADFEPVALEGIDVEGSKRCQVRPGEGQATARVWEEARKALQSAAWSEDAMGYRYRLLSFERILGPRARDVREEEQRPLRGYARNPITSRPAEELIDGGFARRAENGDWLYFAPDAQVLLSDPFLDTHCMSLQQGDDDREGLLGVRFEPVRGRTVPEISGTFWLDAETAELRRLDFRYENLERELDATLNDHVGGEVVFQRLPNGAWIVREWRIRMPLLAMQGRINDYGRRPTLAALHEVGGMVQRVENSGGETVLAAEMATLSGVVVDSTGTEPVPGAEVRLEGTGRSVRTDDDGLFRFSELQEGTYRVTLQVPGLEGVGASPEGREAEVEKGGVASIRLQAPGRGELLAEACRSRWATQTADEVEAPGIEELGVLTGTVREEGGGPPVEGARVEAAWSEWSFRGTVGEAAGGSTELTHYQLGEDRWGAEARTDAEGRFVLCGVPANYPVEVTAAWGLFESDVEELRIPESGGHLATELELPLSTTAAVGGRVVDWESGEPLPGARVALQGTELETRTDSAGAFGFEEVPPGTHPLAVEFGEWSGVADTVGVNSGRDLDVEVRIPGRVIPIEGVVAEVEVLSETERRERARGFASDYVGPEEMATIAEKVYDFAGILREMGSPRVQVGEFSNQGQPGVGLCVRVTRGPLGGQCAPILVVLDGQILQNTSGQLPGEVGGGGFDFRLEMLNDLSADEIESVRVLGPVEARFRYGERRGQYGAILVETRSGGG